MGYPDPYFFMRFFRALLAWHRWVLLMVSYPDPREDLKSRSPNLGPYTTKGYFIGTLLRDLLLDPPGGLGSSRAGNL